MRPVFALLLALALPACGSSPADHSQAADAGPEAAAADGAVDAVADAPKPTQASFKVEQSFTITYDGKNWSAPIQVADCGAVECGYPSMVGLGGGRFLLVYYAPGGTAIEGVIYSATLS